MQCYRKDAASAKCKPSCYPGPDLQDTDGRPWSCEALGPRTPGHAWPIHTEVAPWVKEQCSKPYAACMLNACCRKPGMRCFDKSEGWAICLEDCVPGENRSAYGDVDDAPWRCATRGPRTPRPWGSPSLFCFAVLRTVGYEPGLVKAQLARGAGIFACDEFEVYSNEAY